MRKRMLSLLLVLIVLGAAATLGFFAFGPERVWSRIAGDPDLGRYDFSAARRSPTPNDALACTPGICGSAPDIRLTAVEDTPETVIERVALDIAYRFPEAIRVDRREDAAHLRYVTHSPLMRFPDTTVIEAVRLPEGKTGLRAYARAQLGSSDMGANRTRLESWLGNYIVK